jgi:hypothetical protein
MRRRFIREPETNQDTMQCKHKRFRGENKKCVQKSAGKVMSTVSVLLMEFMPRMYTITNESCPGATKDLLDEEFLFS